MARVRNWQIGREMSYWYPEQRPERQFAAVFDTNKCIACQTCTLACKTTWTSGRGQEYMLWNNVETKPYGFYPLGWDIKLLDKLGGGRWSGTTYEGSTIFEAAQATPWFESAIGNSAEWARWIRRRATRFLANWTNCTRACAERLPGSAWAVLEVGHPEAIRLARGLGLHQVGVVLHGVVRPDRLVVAVLPVPVREIQRPDRRDDHVAEHGVTRLVVGVPDGDARVVPVVAHPVRVLPDHLREVVGAARLPAPLGGSRPHEELVLDQETHLVGDLS
jgi:ferredoxin